MTYEQQAQIYLKASNIDEARQIVEYTLGREAAQEDIAQGKESLAKRHSKLAKTLGEMWTKGYTEYFQSWEILNKSAFELIK